MSDLERTNSNLSITSTHESIDSAHSDITQDERLNDHRYHTSLPIRKESNVVEGLVAILKTPRYEPHSPRLRVLNSSDLRNKMIQFNDGDDFALDTGDDLAVPRTARTRTRSFSDQVKSIVKPRAGSPSAGGILLNSSDKRRNSTSLKLTKQVSRNSTHSSSSDPDNNKKRFARNYSISEAKRSNDNESDADSHASRESQETEEDVCFPMIPEHTRINGIDFGEIDEFINEEREETIRIQEREKELLRSQYDTTTSSSSNKFSSLALKYTPKLKKREETIRSHTKSINSYSNQLDEKYGAIPSETTSHVNETSSSEEGVTFGGAQNLVLPPDRFSFFHSENDETVHAPDLPSLFPEGKPVKDSFVKADGTWWLDCVCPTDEEMKALAKAFGIHPLTAEDIRMQEAREKVELFKSYYFVCFHSFETDNESEDFLEPINVYIVVLRDGILSFHFSPVSHPANVRRRVRQLRDYVNVSADWLCYALIDDITDGFAPVIQAIEYEADAIEDSVFVSRDLDYGGMLQRIGESRRKVMTLMRLLSGKADVIKMFAKRCQDEANQFKSQFSTTNLSGMQFMAGSPPPTQQPHMQRAQPRGDIALYLGDIQDHILTMFQNLAAYEKIFSRSHANYLAQLQVESFKANHRVTEILSKVTVLGTILVPLNLVTGLFGMNVRVPGQDSDTYGWWGGIIGFLVLCIICLLLGARYYLKRVNLMGEKVNEGRSMKSLPRFGRARQPDNRTKSLKSFTSKFVGYEQ